VAVLLAGAAEVLALRPGAVTIDLGVVDRDEHGRIWFGGEAATCITGEIEV
jgi:hypothetical protein